MKTNEVKTKAAIEQEKNQARLDSSEREQARPQVKRVHNLIIVDESGSMEVIRKQAFVGMNETLQTVRKMQEKFPDQEQFVTLLTFDTGHTTWHYDNQPAAHSFAIDEHLEFQQDEAGTKTMFARERRSRERYNCCVAEDATMPVGSFFNEES